MGLEDFQDNRLQGYERKGGLRQGTPGNPSTNAIYPSETFSKTGSRRKQINQFFVNEALLESPLLVTFPLELLAISHDGINFFSIETD